MKMTTADLRAPPADRLPINFALLIVVAASRCPCMKTSTRAPGGRLAPPSSGPCRLARNGASYRLANAGTGAPGFAAPPRRPFQEDTRCLPAPKRLLAR